MAHDRSRSAFDVRQPKHYDSLLAQQGRLLTDDDWNESDEMDKEDVRHTRVDVIGPSGSPDAGFKIINPHLVAGVPDFDLSAGTMYVGGVRTTLEQDEAFSLQKDWLQQLPSDRPAVAADRIDFVYLELYRQPVTAVEDSELREVALGGPDTSVRLRTQRRVHLQANVATENCAIAWKAFSAALTAENELKVDATLTVAPVPNAGAGTNLCSPTAQAGYLGAENQAIRVELGATANTFLWGYDNASPLYRVQVTVDGQGAQVIHFLTTPADEVHWPLAQQVVELLPWSAVLPNNEKVAEIGGLLTTVTASYDPNSQNIKVQAAVPNTFGAAWQTRSDSAALLGPGPGYFYLRVWNRGGDTTSAAEIPFVVGTPVELVGTGLSVSFGGTQFHQGDFWIIAARPNSPATVVPWKLSTGRLAEGVRRFYAPLGIIHWRPNGTTTVFDCRKTFDSLTAKRGCCITLGPQAGWDHIIDDVADVPDLCICFRPGDYTTDRTLAFRNNNVKISGAGGATRISGATETVFAFNGCRSVQVSDLSIRALSQVQEGKVAPKPHLAGVITTASCDHVDIARVTARCAPGPIKSAACIAIYSALPPARVFASSARVENCELVVGTYQVGLSVINYGRTTIRDNSLHVDTGDAAILPAAWLQDAGFRRMFRKALIYRFGLGNPGNPAPAGTRTLLMGNTAAWVQTTPDLSQAAWNSAANWRKLSTHRLDHMTLGEFLNELAEDIIYGNGTVGAHSSVPFKNYISAMLALRTSATNVRGIATQGIVVGGTSAREVRISGNSVRDTVQGIHVGVSMQRPRVPGGAAVARDTADRVIISGNEISLSLMPESVVERHGIFVGNCQSLVVEDNRIQCEKLGRADRLTIDGIRVYGFLGRLLYVTRNEVTGFTTAFRIAALNHKTALATSMWRVTENVAFGCTKTTDFTTKLGGNSQVTASGNLPP